MFNSTRISLAVPACLIVAALLFAMLDIMFQYDDLPQQMASHFDFQGRANGWSSKLEFVVLEAMALVAIITVSALVVLAAYYSPPTLLNIPNRKYWLAPERDARSRHYIAEWGLWFAAITIWQLAIVFHETYAANHRQPPQLEMLWSLLGIYFLAFGFLLIRLIRRFRAPPDSMSEMLTE